MKCPKCGYKRTPHDNIFVPPTECPSCGIVYVKSENDSLSITTGMKALNQIQKASPVDAESLKKARERVEMRLRKQLANRMRDDRHAETLERARRIAAVEVRKRQLKLEQERQKSAQEPSDPTGIDHTYGPAQGPRDMDESSAGTTSKPGQPEAYVTAALAVEETPSSAAVPIKQPRESAASSETRQPEAPPLDTTSEDMTSEDQKAATENDASSSEGVAEKIDCSVQEAADDRPYVMSESAEPLKASDSEARSPGNHRRNKPASDPLPMPKRILVGSEKIPPKTSIQPDPTGQRPPHDNVIPLSTSAIYPPIPKESSPGGLMRLMPLVAWLILCAGVVGAILSWTTLSDVQANVQTAALPSALSAMPMGLLLGFAYLATGVLGFAFFWVSSLITRQLKDIRLLLLYQRGANPMENGIQDQLNESLD